VRGVVEAERALARSLEAGERCQALEKHVAKNLGDFLAQR
jgi:hypothetical protein